MLDRRLALPAFGLVCLVAWFAMEARLGTRKTAEIQADRPAGQNVLLGLDPRLDDLGKLKQMGWDSVAATLDAVGRDPLARDRVIQEAQSAEEAPVRYLIGMLLLAKGETQSAARLFSSMDPASIPATFLYGPYRLQDALGDKVANPFRVSMLRAVESSQVSPLIIARVSGREGRLPESLQAYLRTDPAEWTSYDGGIFSLLLQHSGLAPDSTAMIKAALRDGRVREALRKPLIDLVSLEGHQVNAAELQARLGEMMKPDSPGHELMITVVRGLLESRQLFLNRDYAGLMLRHREQNEATLPDESLLLLTLAASRQNDVQEFERWSRELRRRFPDPSVALWLNSLHPATSH